MAEEQRVHAAVSKLFKGMIGSPEAALSAVAVYDSDANCPKFQYLLARKAANKSRRVVVAGDRVERREFLEEWHDAFGNDITTMYEQIDRVASQPINERTRQGFCHSRHVRVRNDPDRRVYVTPYYLRKSGGVGGVVLL